MTDLTPDDILGYLKWRKDMAEMHETKAVEIYLAQLNADHIARNLDAAVAYLTPKLEVLEQRIEDSRNDPGLEYLTEQLEEHSQDLHRIGDLLMAEVEYVDEVTLGGHRIRTRI